MSVLKHYRHCSFLETEPGDHLHPWSKPARWMPAAAISKVAPTGWSHYVLEPPERALDYLDWINHRYLGLPYWLRRILLPTWLLVAILESVALQQTRRIQQARTAEPCPLDAYAARAKERENRIRLSIERRPWNVQIMRAVRLNSEWLRDRERLLQTHLPAPGKAPGAPPEPVEVRARPWDYLGAGTFRAAATFRTLLDLQLLADAELFPKLDSFDEK